MSYTANPELDAARHEDAAEALDEFRQEAERSAPAIVLKQLKAIKKPGDWFDTDKFHSGNSAESILQGAFDDANDDVGDRYAEFMIDATPAAKYKLLEAMAAWFCKSWAWEVYTEHLESLK